MKNTIIHGYLLSVISALLVGCSNAQFPGLYTVPIEQGSVITQDSISQLKYGMSKEQVAYIMGPSLVSRPFNPDRWDYVYTLRKNGRLQQERHVTVYFTNDQVSHIESTL